MKKTSNKSMEVAPLPIRDASINGKNTQIKEGKELWV